MITKAWQLYIHNHLAKFDSLVLLNLFKRMGWKYALSSVPHLHFSGQNIAAVIFVDGQVNLKHYDFNALGFDSLLPIHFAVEYWQSEREGKPGSYFLLLKALEQQYHENFLKAEIHYKACFNPVAFEQAAAALAGTLEDGPPLRALLIRFSSYLMRQQISVQDLELVLASYLDAQVEIDVKHLSYCPLTADERSALSRNYYSIGRTALLGGASHQPNQKLVVKAKLTHAVYKKLIEQGQALTLLRALIKRLLNKAMMIDFQFRLVKQERQAFRLGASPLGYFSWFSGNAVFDSSFNLKEVA
jgi:predicted component of type VI protein secretion system